MEYWIVGKNGYFIESIREGGVIEFTPHEHLAKRFYNFGEAMEFFKFGYQVIKRESNVVDADPKRIRRNPANTADHTFEEEYEEGYEGGHAYNSERKERTKMRKIKKWNGVLPVTFGGGVAPILDVSDILNTAE